MLGKNAQRKSNTMASGSKTVFYTTVADVEEVRTGYLLKSPPAGRFKSLKSWKRRFFVLFKTSWGTHMLKYYRSEDEREKAQGVIDLSKISVIYPSPEKQTKWEWIHKTFDCPPNCVLYIRANDRDYYLIGERRSEVDGWFSDIYKALRNLSSKEDVPIQRSRSASTPTQSTEMAPAEQQAPKMANRRLVHSQEIKVPENDRWSRYITPKSVLDIIAQGNGEDDDEDEAETKEEVSFYTRMDRVCEILQDDEPLYDNLQWEKEEESKSLSSVTEETKRMKIVDPQISSGGRPVSLIKGNTTEEISDPQSHKQRDQPLSQEDYTTWQEEMDGNNIPKKEEVSVNLSELKLHLKLEDADGKTCVSEWSPSSESTCLFHKGDQILAVNDLQTDCVADVQMFLAKLMKEKVKVTLLRLPGSSGFLAAAPASEARICSPGRSAPPLE